MDAKVLPTSFFFPKSSSSSSSSYHLARRSPTPSLSIPPIRLRVQPLQAINNGGAAGDDGNSSNNSDNREDPAVSTETPRSASPRPPTKLKIKYRARSRNQARQQQEQASARPPPPPPPKKWEDMTLGEKAVELYVGEKGLLFWLNKFAYASIFIVIGGWILFRFVGPSVGLYQLDTPPLSPTSVFKGS